MMQTQNSKILVKLSNVHVSFGDLEVHSGINLSISEKEIITLLGPSGTGKTVILKLIIGLLQPTEGTVEVLGKDLSTLDEKQLREIRMDIGMLFQGAALFDSLNVYENVSFPLKESKKYSEAEIKEIVTEKLSLVNLPDIENKFPNELSGGQKKRVGLARALATSPKVILFDEPTTGLDPTSRNIIDELILCLKDELGITSIVITHDMESARNISDRLILFSEGNKIEDDLASNLWDKNININNFANGNWDI